MKKKSRKKGKHASSFSSFCSILTGTMRVEIRDKHHDLTPETPLIFPAGVPHRNWNAGEAPTVHPAFNPPLPDPELPLARSI